MTATQRAARRRDGALSRRACALSLMALTCTLTGALAFGCEGRPRPSGAAPSSSKSGPAVTVLDLTGGLSEQEEPGFFGFVAGRRTSFYDLLVAIGGAQKDRKSKGIFVRFGGVNIGAARAEELGDVLLRMRQAGTPIYCHADGLSNMTMMAAARGCTRIYVSPAGEVETIGLAAQVIYLRRLLVENLKLSIDVLQVGKFKGAEEPLTRDGPSDEARASLEGVLSDLRATWRERVKSGRAKEETAEAIEDGPFTPVAAKARGLIDGVVYADDALKELEKEAGAGRHRIRFGAGSTGGGDEELGDLVRALAGEGGEHGPIALVRATGSISMSGGSGMFGGRGGITERGLSRLLAEVEKDDDVKVLVLRIDSPGGSALASDLLWHQLMKIRAKKPIVVSVGDMAASGGYYLASTGNVIFAEPMSIVGSIGVVGGKVSAGTALERFGVHAETFPAAKEKPGAASRAAYLSFLSTWDEPTKGRVLESMKGIYDLFLARVAEGRKTTPDKIAPHAEGRIFSGREGKNRGLVDELGGLGAAITRARELAKLPADARVTVMSGRSSVFDRLEDGGGDEQAALRQAASGDPLDFLRRAAPQVMPFFTSMMPLAEDEKVVVAAPYALLVR